LNNLLNPFPSEEAEGTGSDVLDYSFMDYRSPDPYDSSYLVDDECLFDNHEAHIRCLQFNGAELSVAVGNLEVENIHAAVGNSEVEQSHAAPQHYDDDDHQQHQQQFSEQQQQHQHDDDGDYDHRQSSDSFEHTLQQQQQQQQPQRQHYDDGEFDDERHYDDDVQQQFQQQQPHFQHDEQQQQQFQQQQHLQQQHDHNDSDYDWSQQQQLQQQHTLGDDLANSIAVSYCLDEVLVHDDVESNAQRRENPNSELSKEKVGNLGSPTAHIDRLDALREDLAISSADSYCQVDVQGDEDGESDAQCREKQKSEVSMENVGNSGPSSAPVDRLDIEGNDLATDPVAVFDRMLEMAGGVVVAHPSVCSITGSWRFCLDDKRSLTFNVHAGFVNLLGRFVSKLRAVLT
jgi:hypothetical protein